MKKSILLIIIFALSIIAYSNNESIETAFEFDSINVPVRTIPIPPPM
ncbi:hypothetical protein PGC35_02205 [Psychrobacillus sp. PGGUH221]